MKNAELKEPTTLVTPDLSDPVAVKAFIAEMLAKNAEYEKKEASRKIELSLQSRIDAEPRFPSFRKTLVLRRVKNQEEIAPGNDVFDFIEVTDIKHAAKKQARTYVTNIEFATYQEMKAEGVANITYTMLEERMKSKPATGDNGLPDDEAEVDGGEEE